MYIYLGERERAHLVVQLGRFFYIFLLCRIVLPPCINCVLHIAPAGSPALRANVKLARFSGYTLLTFSTVRTWSSRRSVCCKKRPDTCRRTPREKQASETARLRETSAVLVCQYSSDSNGDRHQTPERIDKFKFERKLHHSLRLLSLCFC